MDKQRLNTAPGAVYPLGATIQDGALHGGGHHGQGVNFSLFSKNAAMVELLLFDEAESAEPSSVIKLHPQRNRTFYYWHVFVEGIGAGQVYGYRVKGPFDPQKGHRFDGDKVLIDPYGRAVAVPEVYSRKDAQRKGSNIQSAMKSVVADVSSYDWEEDEPLNRPYTDSVIYEMHVGGFTKHPSSGLSAELRGTYLGLIEKIPYLKDLGVTAVELLPVFQFDEQDAPDGLTNYWGYSPVSFFAPHCGYSSCDDPLAPLDEFRDMVKALHKAGIEVILDVVYNHTAETDEEGPTISFRGLDNNVYYILKKDRSKYANFSGTGNTLNASNTIVRRLILDSLHYWVQEMHVDGFRFDLASILSRGEKGQYWKNPPTLWDIESDPHLASTKLIAEAWDAAGLYQVGSFIGDRWTEWNGQFRDDMRAFFRGDEGLVGKLPARILASPDLYEHEEREPEQSVNFITAHDGFTMNDLVSYNKKHNAANGENNRDGTNENFSWNHGHEGPTSNKKIEKLRSQQIRNFFTINLLSLGTPMILMGDEVRRTQRGNNNPYCQDNEISWFDWRLLETYNDLHRFVKRLISFRLRMDVLRGNQGVTLTEFLHNARIQWHGTKLNQPDWRDNSHSLAITIECITGRCLFHMMLNAYWDKLAFELPAVPKSAKSRWRRVIDTAEEAPYDICEPEEAPEVKGLLYEVGGRSVVVLAVDTERR